MNYREHVQADVAGWPEALASRWQEIVTSARGGAWLKYGAAELELRAWLELRGPVAREPVVVNRHHLCPGAPQAIGSSAWPEVALYCGRAPMAATPLDRSAAWKYAHLLGNPYGKDEYPDALERYRIDLRRWLFEDNKAAAALARDPRCGARRSPRVDAIRDLTPASALVCSCVTSPWTPAVAVKPDERLSREVACHCHLIVVAWRVLTKARASSRAAAPAA